MSDFDENDIIQDAPVAQASSDFDEADVIPMEAPAQEAAPVESSSPLEDIGFTVGGGAAGYGTGKAIQGAANLADKALPGLGNLDRTQLDYISADTKKYREAPPLSQKLDTFRDLAGKNRQMGYDKADEALNTLDNAAPVKTDDYFKTISSTVNNNTYSLPLGKNVRSQVANQTQSEINPFIENRTNELKNTDSRIKELSATDIKRDVKFQAAQQAKIANDELKMARLDNKISKAKNEALEIAIKNKEDFQARQGIQQKRTNFVETDKNLTRYQDRMLELKQLEAKKVKIAQSIEKKIADSKKKADGIIKSKTGVSDEIARVAPEMVDRKIMPTVRGSVEAALDLGRDIDEIPARTMGESYVRALREGNNYDANSSGGFSQKFDKKVAETVRGDLGKLNPEYDALMGQSERAINTEEKFKKLGAVYDETTGKMTLPQGARNNMAIMAASGADDFTDKKELFNTLPEDLKALGIADDPNMLDNLRASAIKQGVKDASVLDISGYDASNAITPSRGLIGTVAKFGKDNFGTKLQEQIALAKGNSFAKGAFKNAPGILGAAGALAGAGLAQAAGDIDSTEAGVLAATDIVNPLPLDTTGGYVAGKKAFNDNVNEQKMTQEYFDGGEVNLKDPWKAALSEGASAAVQPIKDIGNSIEQAGTERSMDARSRMEQNMNAFQSLKAKKKEENKKPDFKGFQKISTMDLQGLAQMLGGSESSAAQSYAAPLEKAANAQDERTKNAVLWGLYQQPAFRQIYKDLNPDEDTEE